MQKCKNATPPCAHTCARYLLRAPKKNRKYRRTKHSTSDTLRKAFEHERIAYNRRTNHEYREVRESLLGVVLSGTPAQIRPLIPSAENGLFSRQVFYFMPPINDWKDQTEDDGDDADPKNDDLDARFHAWGEEWKWVIDGLREVNDIRFRLSHEQKAKLNEKFRSLLKHAGAVHRFG